MVHVDQNSGASGANLDRSRITAAAFPARTLTTDGKCGTASESDDSCCTTNVSKLARATAIVRGAQVWRHHFQQSAREIAPRQPSVEGVNAPTYAKHGALTHRSQVEAAGFSAPHGSAVQWGAEPQTIAREACNQLAGMGLERWVDCRRRSAGNARGRHVMRTASKASRPRQS